MQSSQNIAFSQYIMNIVLNFESDYISNICSLAAVMLHTNFIKIDQVAREKAKIDFQDRYMYHCDLGISIQMF